MRSFENAYLGHLSGESAPAVTLASFVAEHDAALDGEVRDGIAASLAALAAIPSPFSSAITDPAAADEIEAAQTALRALHIQVESSLLPLVR